MRLRLIWTGKTRDARLRELQLDYEKRLSHFARCEIVEIRESSSAGTKAGIDRDSKSISDRLSNGSVAVLLDPEGSNWSSPELAAQIQRWETKGTKEVSFIIGGPHGVSPELTARVQHRWSLTRLTLTHEMARVVLLEQLYRAYTIIHGLPYQK
ncbi:MAG: 23S rRNA (pseudouridine(1915)-N(3))-methyltransferase RlmH [Acidobacteriota bacterium]|nr:23S rRNA (pseudouridine(1915)-N(3))-methyltransferase RlmH [Acidobacteriota bacterium]